MFKLFNGCEPVSDRPLPLNPRDLEYERQERIWNEYWDSQRRDMQPWIWIVP
jgi:hypothetical protein